MRRRLRRFRLPNATRARLTRLRKRLDRQLERAHEFDLALRERASRTKQIAQK